ncbi:MAG: hypothetical protein IPI12_05425 [Ignavibacteriales bacterium]|jgi:hypothetical protein|nr:hypothetical protein [Ignavibacteriales bacterium]
MNKKDDRKKRAIKFRGIDEDYPLFEKFRKSPGHDPDYPYGADDDEINKINSQQFGTGHLVPDKLVSFDGNRPDSSFKEFRPGVVGSPPTKNNRFQTGWYPCSTGSFERFPNETVHLDTSDTGIDRECYILLKYRQYFKYSTLVSRKFELTGQKKTELRNKMNNLEWGE